MVDYLGERAGHEREATEDEAHRRTGGAYAPPCQGAYMDGTPQLRTLRREQGGSGRISDRLSRGAVPRENAIPIEAIRSRMLAPPLTRIFRPSWRCDTSTFEGYDAN